MNPKEQAQVMFPNMPDPVFDIWLAPLIETGGWPFTFLKQSTANTGWHRLLDGVSLESIARRVWTRHVIPCSLDAFDHMAIQTILGICAAHIPDWPAIIPNLSPDQVRNLLSILRGLKGGQASASFKRSRSYVYEHGKLHTPAVLLQEPSGLKIMDGNHRLAAMFSLPRYETRYIDAWIGK